MKKLKKLLVLVLCFSMLSGLCACGGGDEDEVSGDGLTTELSLWFPYGSLSQAFLKEVVDKFNASQEEYYVKIQNSGSVGEVRTKLDSTINPDDYPDLICGTTIATAYYTQATYLADFQSYVDKDEEDWTQGMFTSVRNAYVDSEGNLLGYPLGVSCSGYWVNVDAITEAGYSLDDLTSYEKIAEVATAVVEKDICEYGLSYMGSGIELIDMLTIQGCDFVDSNNGYDGNITKSVLLEGETYKAYKKATEIFADLYKKEVAMPGMDAAGGFHKFNSEKLALVYATNSWGHYVFDAEPEFEYAFIPSVGVDENAEFYGNVICEGTGLYMCNTEDEKRMQGAYEFIKFMAQPENQSLYCQELGYVPYTDEAVAQADYQAWMQEWLPSSANVIEKLKTSPAELRVPFVEFFDEMQAVGATLFSYVSTEPDGDLEYYMEFAAGKMEEGLEIWLERQ